MHTQRDDPSVADAVSDAVRRHLNLTEVTLGEGCSAALSRGVVRGVLQKIGVRKVDVVNSLVLDQAIYPKTSSAAQPECECECVCECECECVCVCVCECECECECVCVCV